VPTARIDGHSLVLCASALKRLATASKKQKKEKEGETQTETRAVSSEMLFLCSRHRARLHRLYLLLLNTLVVRLLPFTCRRLISVPLHPSLRASITPRRQSPTGAEQMKNEL
jgi:hypothetical protein